MTEPKKIEGYIRGTILDDYQDYCPLKPVEVYEENGAFRINDELVVQANDLILKPGFLILELGAVDEDYTLTRAAQAIYDSVWSLFAACDIPVDKLTIRTSVELSEYMKRYRHNYSHLVIIGHGTDQGINFLDKPSPAKGGEIAACLGGDEIDKSLQIISLCCHSGCASLAKQISMSPGISEVIAPNSSFDLRWAVHFVTGYLLFLFIEGMNAEDATQKAASQSGGAPMCAWKNGELIGTCKT